MLATNIIGILRSKSALTSSLWGCYSLTKLIGGYGGNCLKARRSSDNTTQDIGFVGSALDTASLATFVGANDGFVDTWYDQSGGAHDLAQSTQANQPQIVSGGTYLGNVCWDGVTQLMTTGNSGTPTAFAMFLAGRLRRAPPPANAILFNHSSAQMGTVRNTSNVDNYDGAVSMVVGDCKFDDALTSDATTYCGLLNRSGGTIATQNKLYRNGTNLSSIANEGTTVTSSFSAGAWTIGSDGASAVARMAAQTILLYETLVSDANIASISTLIQPAAPTLGLDNYTTGLWAVYSLRKQLSAYSGNCIKVRRSSDNTTQDIGFVNGLLDTASMLTFCGAGNGFIDTFYDQSGNARNATQATTTKQPQIVSSGALVTNNGKTVIKFDGVDDCLQTPNSSATNKFTLFYKGNVEATGTQIIVEQSAGYDTNKGEALYFNASALHVGTGQSGSFATNQYNTNVVGNVVCATFDRSAATSAAMSNLFSGGFKLTRDVNESSGTLPSGNSNAAPWNIGSRNNGASLPTTGDCETVAIYESIVSDANINLISLAFG